jgi:hypothetical protein
LSPRNAGDHGLPGTSRHDWRCAFHDPRHRFGQSIRRDRPTLPAGSVEQEIVPDGEYRVWLARDVVNRLRALREPGETFSDVILRLCQRGAIAMIEGGGGGQR